MLRSRPRLSSAYRTGYASGQTEPAALHPANMPRSEQSLMNMLAFQTSQVKPEACLRFERPKPHEKRGLDPQEDPLAVEDIQEQDLDQHKARCIQEVADPLAMDLKRSHGVEVPIDAAQQLLGDTTEIDEP
jgi:hypothetical protein